MQASFSLYSQRLAVFGQHPYQSTGQFESGLDRIGQPAHQRVAGFHDQSIDDDLDRMFLLLIERDVFAEVDHLPVDPGPDIPGPPHIEQFFPVLALSSTDNRGQDLKLYALRQVRQSHRPSVGRSGR